MNSDIWIQDFIHSCSFGDLPHVQYLTTSPQYSRWINIHALDNRALREASSSGHLSIVQWLTSSPIMQKAQQHLQCWSGYADIHAFEDDALRLACRHGHLPIAQWLTSSETLKQAHQSHGSWTEFCNLHAQGEAPFVEACIYGQSDILRWMIFDTDYEPLDGMITLPWPLKQSVPYEEWLYQQHYTEVISMFEARNAHHQYSELMFSLPPPPAPQPRDQTSFEHSLVRFSKTLLQHARLPSVSASPPTRRSFRL